VTARAESNSSPSPLAKLNDAAAVRDRCGVVHRWVADGRSPHFALDESRLGTVAAYVADVTREAYPDLKIPYHSRWRHFSAGGIDRWGELVARSDADRFERARMAADLATVSVLLDAGAGDRWRYREGTSGLSFARSEGLAVASFDMFRAGAFSADPARPWRVDSVALANIDAAMLARHFQVDAGNPLVGLERRSALLRRLGKALADRADLFAREGARPGNLVDHCRNVARDGRIPAARLLTALLDGLSSIWPSGLTRRGEAAGAHRARRISQRRPPRRSRRNPPARADRSAAAARRRLAARRRMACAHRRADGSIGWSGARKVGARFEFHHAAVAAGRNLERGTKNRARIASARWSSANCGSSRRHGVLRPAAAIA